MMMRSFHSSTTAAALVWVLLLPSAHSFTSLRLGPKQQERAGATTTTTTTTTYASSASTKYDPADAFTTSTADLAVQELESSSQELGPSQAKNMLLDLDGHALSPQYVAQAMGVTVVGDDNTLEDFSYMCSDGFHDFNSDACRIHLLLPDGEVKTAFYKHIVFAQLDHAHVKAAKAPHKLLRDCKSYEVVASFLQSAACSLLREKAGIFIPECYHSVVVANYDNPMESRFSFLLQDFGPAEWSQEWLLMDDSKCFAALSTFAKIHAFFWTGSAFWKNDDDYDARGAKQRELEAAVWKSGSYLEPAKQNINQCRTVAQEWLLKREKFSEQLSSRSYWENLGERLESVAEECGRLAHPFALDDDDFLSSYQKYRTLTHGDPKAANLFFRQSSSENQQLDVGLIDFQWTGFGLAATDIAHFMTSTVHAAELDDGGEERLLRYYFDQLEAHFTEFGVQDKITFETFMDQYEIAVLDICRLMIAYTWSRFTEPASPNDPAACARTMNKTSYNKSVPNVVWLLDRCDEILKSRGV